MNPTKATMLALDATYAALERPARIEGEAWEDEQGRGWFHWDGIDWRVALPKPADVRRAFLQAVIDKERQEPYAMPGNDTCPRCGGTGRV
jgi:hypothetical protein